MVNSADVKSLLMRLHQGAKVGQGGSELQAGMSFVTSLSAEIDAAAPVTGAELKPGKGALVTPKEVVAGAVETNAVTVKDDAREGAATAKSVIEQVATAIPQKQTAPAVSGDLTREDMKTTDDANGAVHVDAVSATVVEKLKGNVAEGVHAEAKTNGDGVKTKQGKEHATRKVTGKEKVTTDSAAAAPVDGAQQMLVAATWNASAGVLPAGAAQRAMASGAGQDEQVGDAIIAAGKRGKAGGSAAVAGVARAAQPGTLANAKSKEKVPAETSDGEDSSSVAAAPSGTATVVQRDESSGVAHTARTAGVSEPVAAMAPIAGAVHRPVESVAKDALSTSAHQNVLQGPAEVTGVELRSISHGGGDRMLVATPSTLEVGVANGTHGWLKIRAELTDTGSVKAVLSSTSASGEQMLHHQLPALSSFLSQERLPVTSLVVHHAAQTSGQFAGMDGGGAAGQQPQGGSSSAGGQARPESTVAGEGASPLDVFLDELQGDLPVAGGVSGGGWLSVRA